jgi:hypothetical protein
MTENRDQLIAQLAKETGIGEKQLRAVLNALAAVAGEQLETKGEFNFPGVGTVVRKQHENIASADQIISEPIPASSTIIHIDHKGRIIFPIEGRKGGSGLPPVLAERIDPEFKKNLQLSVNEILEKI